MENKSNQKSKKSLFIWGVPVLIIIVLILILASELAYKNDDAPAYEPAEKKQVVIDSTFRDDKKEPAEKKVTPPENIDDSEVSQTLSQKSSDAQDKTTGSKVEVKTVLNASQSQEEENERSYIVEEGDSLWKIAQREDFLGDPWKWKTILIQNREKINYTIFSEETGAWKAMISAGKKLVFRPGGDDKNKLSFDRARKKRYAVQLMSLNVNKLEKAVDIVKLLITEGYHAYLYRTREKIKSEDTLEPEYYYRVRIGFFETEKEALKIGEEILYKYEDLNIFHPGFWAVLPSYDELDGELIDFGVQRNKPWIIQLDEQNSRKEAINNLKILTSLVNFSYISQKKNPEGGFLYRARVGFFETRTEANKILDLIRRKTAGKFYTAQILELRHMMELIPGQTTAKTPPK